MSEKFNNERKAGYKKISSRKVPMLQDFAVHGVKYDQQVFSQSEAQAAQHQSCIHHSWHLIAQSLHICQPQEQNSQCSRHSI